MQQPLEKLFHPSKYESKLGYVNQPTSVPQAKEVRCSKKFLCANSKKNKLGYKPKKDLNSKRSDEQMKQAAQDRNYIQNCLKGNHVYT